MSQYKFYRSEVPFTDSVVILGIKYYGVRRGYITIASKYNEEDKIMVYGVSFCSPWDKYNRIEGDSLALQRLKDQTHHLSGDIYINKKQLSYNYSLLKIASDIFSRDLAPSWAQDCIIDIITEFAINNSTI